MRYSRPLFFVAALLVSGSVCAGLWAKGAGARRAASAQLASAQRASGPAVAGYTLASSVQPTSAQRASGPGVAGYTLVTGISLGASSYCPRPGATVTLTATISGSGNEKVTVSFNGAGTLPTCEAKPGDSCSVNYTAPSAESTVEVTASAKGSNPDAATQTSNKVSIVVAKKEWRAEPAIKGDIAAKIQQPGPLPTPTPTPVPGAQPAPPTPPTNPAPPAIPTGSRRFTPGSTVRVMVTDAADEDTCSSCGEDEEETTPDEIKYNWTVGASGTESSATVTMPASEGGTLEMKVEVEDKGEVSGDDKGTRKDEKKTLSMTLYAAYPDPNDPDSDGDGIPDSEDDDPNPGPTPTPLPQPTATPTPTPAPQSSISLVAAPESIVAGGGTSEVTATYSGSTTNAGYVVAFSYRYADATSFSDPVNVTTEADGTAKFPVTSGASTGKIVVKAVCEGQEKETTITVGKPEGKVNVLKQSLIADGQDSTKVELHLTYNGQNVSGHSISWRISEVKDAQGQPVPPDENGNYSYLDYGVLTDVITDGSNETNTTKANGISVVLYTTGTLPGTITFEATDNSVIVNDADSASPISHISADEGHNFAAAGAAPKGKSPSFKSDAQPKKLSPSGTVWVKFSEASPNSGFDGASEPAWLVVPVRDSNSAKYTVNPAEEEPNLIWKGDPRYTATISGGLFTATGVKAGDTGVEVVARDGLAGKLNIAVRDRKRVKVNFFIVRDRYGHHSKRQAKDLDSILQEMNQIWFKQANVVFEKYKVYDYVVDGNLDHLSASDLDKIAKAKPQQGVDTTGENVRNVFFVWSINDPSVGKVLGYDSFDENLFSADSGEYNQGEILAHEAGHSFGVPHPVELDSDDPSRGYDEKFAKYGDQLMFPAHDENRGNRIRIGDVNKAHKSLK